jgi:hypothetical protein
MAHALGIRRCKRMIESLCVCEKHQKTTCLATVARMKLLQKSPIMFDEGLQYALSNLVRELIDALEIFEDLFALSVRQRLDRHFHRFQKGLGRPIEWLRKKDTASGKVTMKVRRQRAPKETRQAKVHGEYLHLVIGSKNPQDIGLPTYVAIPEHLRTFTNIPQQRKRGDDRSHINWILEEGRDNDDLGDTVALALSMRFLNSARLRCGWSSEAVKLRPNCRFLLI